MINAVAVVQEFYRAMGAGDVEHIAALLARGNTREAAIRPNRMRSSEQKTPSLASVARLKCLWFSSDVGFSRFSNFPEEVESAISVRINPRSARPLWSNVYWNFGRCGNSGTGRVPRKNAFRRVSRIRLRTEMCLHAEGAPLGRFVPSCTRKAGLSRKNLRHYLESRLRG